MRRKKTDFTVVKLFGISRDSYKNVENKKIIMIIMLSTQTDRYWIRGKNNERDVYIFTGSSGGRRR